MCRCANAQAEGAAAGLIRCAGYNRAPGSDPVSYTVLGDPTAKAFGIFAALGTIAFAFGDTILPEIQASRTTACLHAPCDSRACACGLGIWASGSFGKKEKETRP
jgi:hypothetical protein